MGPKRRLTRPTSLSLITSRDGAVTPELSGDDLAAVWTREGLRKKCTLDPTTLHEIWEPRLRDVPWGAVYIAELSIIPHSRKGGLHSIEWWHDLTAVLHEHSVWCGIVESCPRGPRVVLFTALRITSEPPDRHTVRFLLEVISRGHIGFRPYNDERGVSHYLGEIQYPSWVIHAH